MRKNITVGALIEQLRAFDPEQEVTSEWDIMEMPCYGVLNFHGRPVLMVDRDDLTVEWLEEYAWPLSTFKEG